MRTNPSSRDPGLPTLVRGIAATTAISVLFPIQAAAGPFAQGIYVDPVSAEAALEIRAGYDSGTSKILYAGIYNDSPNNNVLEFRMFSASPTGVTQDQNLGAVDSGPLFGLGDWCFSLNYAIAPFIKNFSIYGLRYDLTAGTFDTFQIADSVADQYVSTDCMSFDNGTELVVAANNFDDEGIDYFESTDGGANWDLAFEYRLSAGVITNPFAGAFRDTHASVDDFRIGATYQRGDGLIEGALLERDGTLTGTRTFGDAASYIGNGYLKELDGLGVMGYCLGGANTGTQLRNSFVDTGDGTVGVDGPLDNQATGSPAFDFNGIDFIAADSDVSPNLKNLYVTSNFMYRFDFDGTTGSFNNHRIIVDYPFENIGGAVDGFASEQLGRIFMFAPGFGGPSGNLGTYVATIDPQAVNTAAVTPGAPPEAIPVPANPRLPLALLALAIALLGGGLLKARAAMR